MMITRFLRCAKSPSQRVGGLLVITGSVLWLLAVILWQMDIGFVHVEIKKSSVKIRAKMPSHAPQGMRWERIGGDGSVYLIDLECRNASLEHYDQHGSFSEGNEWWIDCIKERVHPKYKSVPNIEFRNTLWRFLGRAFETRTRRMDIYSKLFFVGMLCLLAGGAGYYGYAEKFLRWVKYGKSKGDE